MLKIAEDDNGRRLILGVGDELEVSLAENASTGYQWELAEKAEPVCKLVNDDFQAAGTTPGSSGVHRWQFRAVQPGGGEISLQYRRPWEEDATAARSYLVKVTVRK
jgi:inhibitor of cysteine peptidase